MLVKIFFIVSALFAVKYTKKEAFEFTYNSQISNVIEGANANGQSWVHSCTAHFEIKLASQAGAYIALSLKNVKIGIRREGDDADAQFDDDFVEAYAHPVYFYQLTDGTVENITENVDDPEDINDLKHGIINSMRTLIGTDSSEKNLRVTDRQGSHLEHFVTEKDGQQLRVSSKYSEVDFNAFSDPTLDKSMLSMDVSNTRLVQGEKIMQSATTVRVNHKQMSKSNDDSSSISTIGKCTLEQRKTVQSNGAEFPYASQEEFLAANKHIRIAPHLIHENVIAKRREHLLMEEYKHKPIRPLSNGGSAECPGDVKLCRVYNKSYELGVKKFAGITLNPNTVIGFTPGCKLTDPRSYIAGAYFTAGAHVLSYEFPSSVDAYAEYGQMYGDPVRNGVMLKWLQQPVWSLDFPTPDCEKHGQKSISKSAPVKIGYSIPILVLTIHFEAGFNITAGLDVDWDLCQTNFNSEITLTPSVELSFFGGATASIQLIKGGVSLTGGMKEQIPSTAKIDTDKCQATASAQIVTEPFHVALEWWYEERTCRNVLKCGSWGRKHTGNIFDTKGDSETKTLFNETLQ